jgi:hypothetical protein
MMQYLNYDNAKDKSLLAQIDDEWPFQFLNEYSNFIQRKKKEKLLLVYNPSMNAFLPLRIFKSSVFTFGQILHAPVSNANELQQREQLVFFNLLLMDLKSKNLCDRLVQPHPYGILAAIPPMVSFCEFGTYITHLEQLTPDEIFSSISDKYQKAIKHSKKHGAVVKSGWEYFHDFYPLLIHTLEKAGIEVEPVSYFEDLRHYLGNNFSTVAVVYDGNNPVGGAFFLFSKYAAFCTHAGSSGKTKLYGAMKFLHYEMMLHFKSLGVKKYDLVGVRIQNPNPKLQGIFNFKKGFGGELKTGYLWKADINKRKLFFYDWIQKIRNPQGYHRDIIDQTKD